MGTKEGAKKAKQKLLEKDPDYFKRIGTIGGKNGKGLGYQGGFAHPNADPQTAGQKGGRVSRRGKTVSTLHDPLIGKTYKVDEEQMQAFYEQASKPIIPAKPSFWKKTFGRWL